MADLILTEENVVMSKLRWKVALSASYEIEALATTLRECIIKGADGCDLLARGMTARLEDLSQSIMSALNDKDTETETLHFNVHRSAPVEA